LIVADVGQLASVFFGTCALSKTDANCPTSALPCGSKNISVLQIYLLVILPKSRDWKLCKMADFVLQAYRLFMKSADYAKRIIRSVGCGIMNMLWSQIMRINL